MLLSGIMVYNFMKIIWVEFHEGVGCLKIRQKHQDNFYATIFLKCVGGASLMVPVLEYEKQFQISKASLNILQWHCFEWHAILDFFGLDILHSYCYEKCHNTLRRFNVSSPNFLNYNSQA